MLHPRNILTAAGVLLLLVGGWFSWRNSQPVLSDEEQITARLENLQKAVEDRSSKQVSQYFAKEFTWNGQSKSELQSAMNGAFLQFRDVTANITGLKISTNGENATATGKYSFTYKPSPRASSEASLGEFKLQLEKQDGEWLIIKAEGGPSPNL